VVPFFLITNWVCLIAVAADDDGEDEVDENEPEYQQAY
jgi:hypothetical protein